MNCPTCKAEVTTAVKPIPKGTCNYVDECEQIHYHAPWLGSTSWECPNGHHGYIHPESFYWGENIGRVCGLGCVYPPHPAVERAAAARKVNFDD